MQPSEFVSWWRPKIHPTWSRADAKTLGDRARFNAKALIGRRVRVARTFALLTLEGHVRVMGI